MTTTEKSNQPENTFDTLPLPVDSTTLYFKVKGDRHRLTTDALDTFTNSGTLTCYLH
jgi:hypothetical protein